MRCSQGRGGSRDVEQPTCFVLGPRAKAITQLTHPRASDRFPGSACFDAGNRVAQHNSVESPRVSMNVCTRESPSYASRALHPADKGDAILTPYSAPRSPTACVTSTQAHVLPRNKDVAQRKRDTAPWAILPNNRSAPFANAIFRSAASRRREPTHQRHTLKRSPPAV